jgi:hypothetical protein
MRGGNNKNCETNSNLRSIIAQVNTGVGWHFSRHSTVNHGEKEYVRGAVYSNTVENYFSILKRGVYGIYQHVSEAHLKRYLCEYDFRYSYRVKLGYDDVKRADLAIEGAYGERLTYARTRRQRPTQTA